jgi:hypothetical protein
MRWTLAAAVPALLLQAFGGSGNANSCGASRAQALAHLQSAVDANLSCSKDADCTVVTFAAGCFDACTRVVDGAGVAAVNAAINEVNAGASQTRSCGGSSRR